MINPSAGIWTSCPLNEKFYDNYMKFYLYISCCSLVFHINRTFLVVSVSAIIIFIITNTPIKYFKGNLFAVPIDSLDSKIE